MDPRATCTARSTQKYTEYTTQIKQRKKTQIRVLCRNTKSKLYIFIYTTYKAVRSQLHTHRRKCAYIGVFRVVLYCKKQWTAEYCSTRHGL